MATVICYCMWFLTCLSTAYFLYGVRSGFNGLVPRRVDARAVQYFHVGNPLRIVGVALVAGLIAAVLLSGYAGEENFTQLLLLSVVPVFLACLVEDMGYGVSSRVRFAAAIDSEPVASALLGVSHAIFVGEAL